MAIAIIYLLAAIGLLYVASVLWEVVGEPLLFGIVTTMIETSGGFKAGVSIRQKLQFLINMASKKAWGRFAGYERFITEYRSNGWVYAPPFRISREEGDGQ